MTADSSALRTRRIFRTAAALLSVQAVTWLTSLINVAVLPRFLGAEEFGFGATAWTAVALASLLAGFGTSNLLIKETARNPERARTLVLHAMFLRGALWLLICLATTPFLLLFVSSGVLLTILAVSAVSGLLVLWVDAILAGLQGLERLGRASLLLGLLSFAGTGITFVVLVSGGRIIAVTLSSAVMSVLSFSVASATLLAVTTGGPTLDRKLLRSMFLAGPPYLAWDLGQKIYASIDLILLSMLTGAAAVGSYAFAYRLISIPVFAATIVTMSVYPSLSASARTDDDWFRSVVSNAARLCFLVTAPMAIGIAVLSSHLVDLLSGGGFETANIPVVILALHIPPVALHTVLGMALFARDRQRRMAMLAWIAASVNIVANLALIPLSEHLWGNGAIGAAIVTLSTELAMGMLVWRWAWGFIDHRAVLSGVVKTLVACGLMAGVSVFADSASGLLAAIIAGGLTFVLASACLGAVSVSEIRVLAAQLRAGRVAMASVDA